jgi:DNA replication and repair protein RecF
MDLKKSYRMTRDADREFFLIQGSKITRPKYMQALPWRTVHISPFDMNLLYFAPAMRRDYIDAILSRTHEQFSRVRRDYELVMKQRNAMLKKIRDQEAERRDLDFWDNKFAELAYVYGLYRVRYRDYVRSSLSRFPDFFAKYSPVFHYESTWIDQENPEEFIKCYLSENRERDILT